MDNFEPNRYFLLKAYVIEVYSAATMATPRPLMNPAQGPVNASLPSIWDYLEPALDHILRSPSNDPSGKAPAIDIVYYMGIHTAVFNYLTASRAGPYEGMTDRGTRFFKQVDGYLADIAKETLLGAPHDDATLIAYYVPCFNRYFAGMESIDRLFS